MTLRFAPKQEASRFTVVAGKRVSLQATKRNRVKRQLRAALREHILAIPAGTLLVITVKPEALGKSSDNLSKDLTSLIKKIS